MNSLDSGFRRIDVLATAVHGGMTVFDLEELELAELDPQTHILLDVRSKMEIRVLGALDGAVSIPIDDLRDHLKELDKEKTYIVYCAVGQRAYGGYRILAQNGFRARNLSGGFLTYQLF